MKILRVSLLVPLALALTAQARPAGPAPARLSKPERIALCEKKKDVPFAPGDPQPLELKDRGINRPVLIRQIDFTEEAGNRRGFVLVEAVIDEDGCVRQAKAVKGAGTILATAVIKSFQRWVFEPATRDGHPVRVKYILTVNLE